MEINYWGDAEQGWRKGPWTPEEDKVLVEYVSRYGEGRWSSVSKCAGLNRSGKSCRLRWVNYLRPGLKKGHITPQEEGIIIELHALWGNKWSTIARYLPGRTDNEIKNYWRTHFKKRKSSCDQSKMQCQKQQVGKDNKIIISNVEASDDQGAGPTTRHEDEQGKKDGAVSESEGGKSNNNELLMQDYSTCYWPADDHEYCLNNINGGLWEMDDQSGCSKMAIQNQPNINANYSRGGGGGGGGGDAMNYMCGGYIY